MTTTTTTTKLSTFTATIPAAEFPAFRRMVIRGGGNIIVSSPVGAGFRVTYTA